MITWLLSEIPWWIWAIIAVIGIGALQFYVGWKAAAGLAFATALAFVYRQGAVKGKQATQEKEIRDAQRAIVKANDARVTARKRNAAGKLRDDDGFKRPASPVRGGKPNKVGG